MNCRGTAATIEEDTEESFFRPKKSTQCVDFLCVAGKDHVQVGLLRWGEIRMAEYLTELPPRQVLQDRLLAARRRAMELVSSVEKK